MDLAPVPLSASGIALLEAVSVANIDSPTELNAIAGVTVGERRVCYQAIANDNVYTVYYFDASDGSGASSPYVLAASGSGFWIAGGGKYTNSAVSLRSTLAVTGAITGSSTVQGTRLISTIATGTAPLSVTSTTVVPNLNVSQLEGGTWEVPGTIGSTTANTGAFTTLSASGNIACTSTTVSLTNGAAGGTTITAKNNDTTSTTTVEFDLIGTTTGGASRNAARLFYSPNTASSSVFLLQTGKVSGILWEGATTVLNQREGGPIIFGINDTEVGRWASTGLTVGGTLAVAGATTLAAAGSTTNPLIVIGKTGAGSTEANQAVRIGNIGATNKFIALGYDSTNDYGYIAGIQSATGWLPLSINPYGSAALTLNGGGGATTVSGTLAVTGTTAHTGAVTVVGGSGGPTLISATGNYGVLSFNNTASFSTGTAIIGGSSTDKDLYLCVPSVNQVHLRAGGTDMFVINGSGLTVTPDTALSGALAVTGTSTLATVNATTTTTHIVAVNDAATNSASGVIQYRHTTSGTPTGGFGIEVDHYLHSSTNTSRPAFSGISTWVTATDASRAAKTQFYAWDTGARECLCIQASGSAPMVGLYGTAAAIQYATTGTSTGFTAGAGTTATSLSTFTGNTGSTAYTVGDIVRALKLIGVMAA